MTMLEKILALLDSQNLKQVALEQMAGLSKGRISKWKDGTGEPSAAEIWRISQCLRVPVDYLLDDRQETIRPLAAADDEELILKAARRIGLDEAFDRLVNVPRGAEAVTGEHPAIHPDRKAAKPKNRLSGR